MHNNKTIILCTLIAAAIAPQNSASAADLSQAKAKVADVGISFISDQTKQYLSNYLNYVDLSVSAGDSLEGPSYDFTVLKAYDNGGSEDGFFFNQLSANRYDQRDTINIGTGYRHFFDDKKWLLGANVFYDHEFPNHHARASAGIEVKSSVVSYTLNGYEGLTDYKTDRSGINSKALDGYDMGLDVALPYLPGAKVSFQDFTWYGDKGATDLEGYKVSLNGNLFENLHVDAGRTFYDGSTRKDDNWVKLSFQINFGKSGNGPTLFDVQDAPYRLIAIDHERYKPVKRENRIVKQKAFAATVTGN